MVQESLAPSKTQKNKLANMFDTASELVANPAKAKKPENPGKKIGQLRGELAQLQKQKAAGATRVGDVNIDLAIKGKEKQLAKAKEAVGTTRQAVKRGIETTTEAVKGTVAPEAKAAVESIKKPVQEAVVGTIETAVETAKGTVAPEAKAVVETVKKPAVKTVETMAETVKKPVQEIIETATDSKTVKTFGQKAKDFLKTTNGKIALAGAAILAVIGGVFAYKNSKTEQA